MNIGKNTLSAELLRGFVERIETINEQIKQLGKDKSVVMAEAKAANLLPAGIGYIVKKRKLKPSERAEAEALEDMYLHAMGMAADNPLFRAVGLIGVDIAARDSVVEAMKKFVPANGSITVEAGGAPVRLTRDAAGNVSVAEVVEKPVETKPKDANPGAPKSPSRLMSMPPAPIGSASRRSAAISRSSPIRFPSATRGVRIGTRAGASRAVTTAWAPM